MNEKGKISKKRICLFNHLAYSTFPKLMRWSTYICISTQSMENNFLKWLLFIALSLIWGSSFILMKEGLVHLNSYQVASVRIVASGLVLLPILRKAMHNIPFSKWYLIFLSGTLGSLLPAYLFCTAETGIDSSLAGALNSLTPIFVIITGFLFFQLKFHQLLILIVKFHSIIFQFPTYLFV